MASVRARSACGSRLGRPDVGIEAHEKR